MSDSRLSRPLLDELRPHLADVSAQAVAAIMDEVPTYNRALDGPMGDTITNAVQMALDGFLRVAARDPERHTTAPLSPVVKGAYALGAAEARSGRSIEALLAAYRIGARVSWRELSAAALTAGVSAEALATLAELVFAYIDELSASSVAGHTDQHESSGRIHQQRLDHLGQALLRGDSADQVDQHAERAEWRAPRTLTAVLLPPDQVRPLLAMLPGSTLLPSEAPLNHPDHVVLLVAGTGSRASLLKLLAGRQAVVGPTRPWRDVRPSYLRAVRALELSAAGSSEEPVDSEAHLPELIVTADAEALADLRARALAPLGELSETSREKMEATLRAWLLRQGRRDLMATDLFVHAQTVRYRMGQLRGLFGDALDDPEQVLDLMLALAVRPS